MTRGKKGGGGKGASRGREGGGGALHKKRLQDRGMKVGRGRGRGGVITQFLRTLEFKQL